MKQNFKRLGRQFLLLLSVSVLASCSKDVDFSSVSMGDVQAKAGNFTLGTELEDPYRYENMATAFALLLHNGVAAPISSLDPTGKYIRIKVHTDDEEDFIKSDTTYQWYNFPMHYEISGTGRFYHDATLPDTVEWLYAVVPTTYETPTGYTVEEIYQVFIPDDHPLYAKNTDFFDQLEETSDSLTSQSVKVSASAELLSTNKSEQWTPSATVTAWDDVKGAYIPIQGVKIRAKRCTKSCEAHTNAAGYCVMSRKFKGQVTYTMPLERAQWKIVTAVNGRRTKLAYGPSATKEGAWTVSIKNTAEDLMRMSMYRAAMQAFYSSNWTIEKPTHGSLGWTRLSLEYVDNSSLDGVTGKTKAFGYNINSDITIWGKDAAGQYRTASKIFTTTIHELGHQSHYRYVNNFTRNYVNGLISESWADCIEWKIATDYYRNLLSNNTYEYPGNNQLWTVASLHGTDATSAYYSPLYIDFMDNFNQYGHYGGNALADVISGYTLAELQEYALNEVINVASLRDHIILHPLHGNTVKNIEDYLDQYGSH